MSAEIKIKPTLLIASINNGYIVKEVDFIEEENDVFVIGGVDNMDQVDKDIELLWTVFNSFGMYNGKYEKWNVNICKVFGDKYEIKDEDSDDVSNLLNDIWFMLPNGIDLRCEKHPEYDGKQDPVDGCKQCEWIHKFKKDFF